MSFSIEKNIVSPYYNNLTAILNMKIPIYKGLPGIQKEGLL